MSEPRYVSRKAAAEELGISRQRLEVLIKQGRIEETERGIDIDKAKAARAAMYDPARQMVRQPEPAAPPTAAEARKSYAVERGSKKVEDETGELFDFAEARAKKENWNAALAEANYKQKIGALIPRDEVAAKEFSVARKLRDRILQWPAKLVHFIPPDAMQLLTQECESLVRDLQEDAASIAEPSQVA